MGFNSHLLDGLVVFVEVAKQGSFTKAAQSSGFSSSYISKEISKLEERLGLRLFTRSTRSINLTPDGDLYYQQCLLLLNDAQEAENSISGSVSVPQGLLKISVPIGFALSCLRPILADFLLLYPKIELDIELDDRKVDLIKEGFDLAVRISSKLENSSLICKKVMSSQIITVASKLYLQKHGTPLHPNDLLKHKTITYSHIKNSQYWRFKLAAEDEFIVPVKSQVSCNNAEMELALCLAGYGVIRLPEFYLRDELQTGKLVELFREYEPNKLGVYLLYPSRKHLSAKVRCFIDFLDQRLKQQPAAVETD